MPNNLDPDYSMMEGTPPALSAQESKTRVDLGEDLLEKTAVSATPDQIALKSEIPQASDLILNAKILIGENLIEDAKGVLRQVLIAEPGNIAALQLLDDLQKKEIKRMIQEEESWRPRLGQPSPEPEEIDSEKVLRELDRDLNLGIFSGGGTETRADKLSLFQDPELMASYAKEVERSLVGADVQDWIDMGIAFLEMDLYWVAIPILSGACRRLNVGAPGDYGLALSATSLLAFALILADRPFEAASKIQPLLRDTDIPRAQKVELFYLMGRVYEVIDKRDLALEFYSQVRDIEPHYRDIDLRLPLK